MYAIKIEKKFYRFELKRTESIFQLDLGASKKLFVNGSYMNLMKCRELKNKMLILIISLKLKILY